MGLHARHLVGRAYHGEEARQLLAAHKRDSHGSELHLHVPDGYDGKPLNNQEVQTATADDVQTAVSVVYVTLSQTFEGSASYLTMTSDDSTSSSSAAQMQATALQAPARSSATSSAIDPDEASYAAAKSSANAVTSSTMAAATLTAASTLATTPAAAVGGTPIQNSQSNAATAYGGTPLQATHAATSTAGVIEQTNSGMSGGAKAGLAFGIIIALALAFGLILFCWRRKKNTKDQEEVFDEKHSSFVDASARRIESENSRASVMSEKVPASLRSTRTASTAPRLSLRPVTQFLPNLAGNTTSEKPKSAWERKPANTQDNPFDDAPVLSEKEARPISPPSNPFEEGDAPIVAAAATAATTDAKKHTPKSSWEGSEPATPKSTKFGTAAAVPVGAAAANGKGPAARGPNNVHRVQLDFKPSMEDELELRSGQLVRMLHEYDDGWALCIRMDRSQQGVAPRTCLSKLPVKPRPQGPPPQGSRPGTAQSHNSNHSLSSNGSAPRPLTPQMNRPQSPSIPARKPVPGQAM